jgi:hypothetical protein
MNWKRLYYICWQGVFAFTLAFGTAVAAIGGWPTRYQWLILLSGGAMAGAKGIDAYLRDGK